MIIAFNKVGFSIDEPTTEEMDEYKEQYSTLTADRLTDEAVIEQLINSKGIGGQMLDSEPFIPADLTHVKRHAINSGGVRITVRVD